MGCHSAVELAEDGCVVSVSDVSMKTAELSTRPSDLSSRNVGMSSNDLSSGTEVHFSGRAEDDPQAVAAAIKLQRSWRGVFHYEPAAKLRAEPTWKGAAPPKEVVEHLLVVLLSKGTWEAERGERLAQHVGRALTAGVKVALLHDVNSCPFRDVIEPTPSELQQAGLYRKVATDYLTGRAEAVSAAHFALALGAQRVALHRSPKTRPRHYASQARQAGEI